VGVLPVADATRISAGMARVNRVLLLADEQPARTMSRTGSRAQEFNGA